MDNPNYRSARILEIQPETIDTSSYLFALEDEQEFQFSPGQFNMLGMPGAEESAISFSSLARPGSSRFIHTIRRVGNVTRLIGESEIGRRLMIRGPFGNGWPIERAVGCDILLVAGGVGLAPVRPFLLHCLENRNQIRNLVLIFGARTPDDMIFQKDLALWQDQVEVTTIYCVDQLTTQSSLQSPCMATHPFPSAEKSAGCAKESAGCEVRGAEQHNAQRTTHNAQRTTHDAQSSLVGLGGEGSVSGVPLQLRVGLVTQFMEDMDLNLRNTLACVCGPEIMMRFVVRNLLLQGYREDRIYVSMERRMRCGTGHCGHCQIGSKFVCQDGPIFLYPDIKRFADTVL